MYGERDADGRLTGEVRTWSAEGVLLSIVEHVAGVPHGRARHYFANGELAEEAHHVDGVLHGPQRHLRSSDPDLTRGQLARLPPQIATHVCVHEHGDLIGQRYFDAAGEELTSNGAPMPARPPGVPATAFPIERQGWFSTRRRGEVRLESREYFTHGTLRREVDDRTGLERSYYPTGGLRVEGARNLVGASRHLVGDWRHYDREGRLYRITTYAADRPSQRRVYERWLRPGSTREGAIDRGIEVGTWQVRTVDAVEQLALGDRLSDAELLDHPVCADELDPRELDPCDRSLPALLARLRRAGAARDPALIEAAPGPSWHDFDDEGAIIPLASHPSPDLLLVEHVQAQRWERPGSGRLAAIAGVLFHHGRITAALDVLDAAIAVAPATELHQIRASYLRALGRFDEADLALPRPDRLDARALELLAEIRAHPDDDAPRLVFADHVADRFPAHAELIVAQCQGRTCEPGGFLATLPAWLRALPVRGFLEAPFGLEAEQLLALDPDLLYRVCPTLDRLELADARTHLARLVTMPELRRYRALTFTDTYLDATAIAQLAACPLLDQLEALGLARTGLGDEELQLLAGALALPRLASLDLGYGREDQYYTCAGIRALGGAPFAAVLADLSVRGRRLGDELVEELAAFPALRCLDLSGTGLTDRAAERLAAWNAPLIALDVSNNAFSDAARRRLAHVYGARLTI